jgi:hypothetical protein
MEICLEKDNMHKSLRLRGEITTKLTQENFLNYLKKKWIRQIYLSMKEN